VVLERRWLSLAIVGFVLGGGLGMFAAAAHPSSDGAQRSGTERPDTIDLLDCTGKVVGARTRAVNEAVDAPAWTPPAPPGVDCAQLTVELSTQEIMPSPSP
jgi:hypothetical protein